MRSLASSFMSALNQVARLAGAVVQGALRSHLLLVQRSHRPGFVEKDLPRGYVFNDNRNIERTRSGSMSFLTAFIETVKPLCTNEFFVGYLF
jgi:hypothetical protein